MNIPVSTISGIAKKQKESQARGQAEIRLSIMVLAGTPAGLIQEFRTGFFPRTHGGRLHVEGVSQDSPRTQVNALSDAAFILAGPDSSAERAAEIWRSFATAGVRCCVVFTSGDSAATATLTGALSARGVQAADICSAPRDHSSLLTAANWLIGALSDEAAEAAAANFIGCQRAQAEALVRSACSGNAVASLLGLLPTSGADILVMTANQVELAMKLATLYGQPMSAERLRELVPVLLGGPVWRGAARLLSRALPVPKIAVRVGVGAGGTLAIGKALIAYFERLQEQQHSGQQHRAQSGQMLPAAEEDSLA